MMKAFKTIENQKKRKAIEDLNSLVRKCTKCRLSVSREHAIAGEGDLNARIMLVALSPGKNENIRNQMFIGPSGQILDRLFRSAGIKREWFYMTNLIKCILPGNRKPKMDEIESCKNFLEREISIIDPEVIVPLGYYASRTMMTRYSMDPPARKDFSAIYGRLFYSDDQKILLLPHPATLFYNPSLEAETLGKYKVLKTLSSECKWFPLCPMKRFYETGKLDRKWIELYCRGNWMNCVRYEMEEQGRYHPDWMLPDGYLDEKLKPS